MQVTDLFLISYVILYWSTYVWIYQVEYIFNKKVIFIGLTNIYKYGIEHFKDFIVNEKGWLYIFLRLNFKLYLKMG